MFHCFTFFLVICFCILRLSLNAPALHQLFYGVSPQGGEKWWRCGSLLQIRGSPPRGRGKVTRLYALADLEGITPAWAGKSQVTAPGTFFRPDHPRVGGEKAAQRLLSHSDPGSPPRRRGKDVFERPVRHFPGITPAWAGKRPCAGGQSRPPVDHPRVGGEKPAEIQKSQKGKGSPPHGRGKGHDCAHPCKGVGITPAWAGKRWTFGPSCTPAEDHPRVGGEKTRTQMYRA